MALFFRLQKRFVTEKLFYRGFLVPADGDRHPASENGLSPPCLCSVGRQHDEFLHAIALGVLVSARASF